MEIEIAQSILILKARYNLIITFKYISTTKFKIKIKLSIWKFVNLGFCSFDYSLLSQLLMLQIKLSNKILIERFRILQNILIILYCLISVDFS